MNDPAEKTPLAEDQAPQGYVLLIIDMVSDWNFPDEERLLSEAEIIAPRISELKKQCRTLGIRTVYANDNQGRWRSDFKAIVQSAERRGGAAQRIANMLVSDACDYFLLKPKHSAFHSTASPCYCGIYRHRR